MKALTISQPFADLIALGLKWVENRTWRTSYRGPLAIHAGKGSRYLNASELRQYDRGCFVAVCTLSLCVLREWLESVPPPRHEPLGKTGRTIQEVLDHPHMEGPWCWILRDVRRITTYVPYIGQRGLFDVPDEVIEQALSADEPNVAAAESGRGNAD